MAEITENKQTLEKHDVECWSIENTWVDGDANREGELLFAQTAFTSQLKGKWDMSGELFLIGQRETVPWCHDQQLQN